MNKWGVAAMVGGALSLFGLQARADDAPLGLSVSLERVAGFSYGSARLDAVNGGSYGATAFTLAGAAIDPIDLPRAAADVILQSGITLGGALGYSHAALSVNPDNGQGGTINGEAWLISPRVGYRIHVSPLIDVWPRVGLTFARAGFTDAASQSCSTISGPGMPPMTTCATTQGDSDSLFYSLISLDLAAALRVTQSFNVLGGIAYDQVFAASGSQTQNGISADIKAGGSLLAGSLWFGLGGYVL